METPDMEDLIRQAELVTDKIELKNVLKELCIERNFRLSFIGNYEIAHGERILFRCSLGYRSGPTQRATINKSSLCPFELVCKKDHRVPNCNWMITRYRSEHNHPLQ
jgi:hypothetical protein